MKEFTDKIKHAFKIDAQNGRVFWAIRPSNRVNIGDEAGNLNPATGRWQIGFNGRAVSRAHIVFAYVYGYLPENVDHKNRDSTDDRISNLRAASVIENGRNSIAKNKNGLPKGVSRYWNGGYRATINISGKQIHLGLFDTVGRAADAYEKAAKLYFGEFALCH